MGNRNQSYKTPIIISSLLAAAIYILITFSQFQSSNLTLAHPPGFQSATMDTASDKAAAPVYYADKVAILLYHHMDNNERSNTISPQRFREHIEVLKKKGYNFISLSQLSDFLGGKQIIPPNAVTITFDDGYKSFYSHAYPILLENNIPATMFVIVKNVGATKNQIPKLTWDQMKEMQAHGMRFYSHSYNSHQFINKQDETKGPALISHSYLPKEKREETTEEYTSRITNDLTLSKTILVNELKFEVNSLALPFGAGNAVVKQAARDAGFQFVFTTVPGVVDKYSDPMALERINAGQASLTGENIHSMIINHEKKRRIVNIPTLGNQ